MKKITLGKLYKAAIEAGIKYDPRGKEKIKQLLKEKKELYNKLPEKEKAFFDQESLTNPYADTRILFGNIDEEVQEILVGIDIGGEELLLADKLRQEGKKIDLIVSHHPAGKAYASFYEVMDLQTDVFNQQGLNINYAHNLVQERKSQVRRRVHGANHQRVVDMAKWLKLNFICIHTAADNCAYGYILNLVKKTKPSKLEQVLNMLLAIPEYKNAAQEGNPPQIFVGDKNSPVSKIHIEFTGGTEGPRDIYQQLSSKGVDTIIAMHQSEEHVQRCRQANINVVVASHIASDTLGMNVLFDEIFSGTKVRINCCSGYRRFPHSKS